MSVEWILGITFPIVLTLVGVIYRAGQKRDDEIAEKLEEHIKEESKRDMEVARDIALLKDARDRHERQIGDHDRGIVARLHNYSKAIRRIFTKLDMRDED